MNCINKNSKEFKALQSGTEMSPIVLAMKVSKFQEENGLDSFPTIYDITGIEPSARLAFDTNPNLKNIGSLEEYSKYLNTVKKPTQEGFQKYAIKNAKPFEGTYQKVFSQSNSAINDNIDWNNVTELTGEKFEDAGFEQERKNEFNNLIFGGKEPSQSFSEVLGNIRNVINDRLTPEINTLLNKFDKMSKVTNPTITYSTLDPDVAAQYDSETNTITLNDGNLVTGNVFLTLSTLLHEVAHSTTVGIVKNPKNKTEENFISTIQNLIDQFQKVDDSYGFTSVEEFIAEVYSNPEFAARLKELMTGKNKSLWSRVVEAIRRVFNLTNKDVYTTLVEDIIQFTETARDGFNDVGVFNKIYQQPENLTTHENKVNNLLNKMKDAVDNQLKVMKANRKKIKQNVVDYANELQDLKDIRESLNTVQGLEALTAIEKYAEEVRIRLAGIKNKIVERTEAYDKKAYNLAMIRSYEELIAEFSLGSALYDYAIDAQSMITNNNDPDTRELIDSILAHAKAISLHKQNTESLLHIRKKNIVKEFLADKKFLARVDQKFIDQYSKTYKLTKPAGYKTREEYIAKMMVENEAEIQEAREEYVNALIENTGNDISSFDRYAQDTLNINSPFVAMATNMVFDFREKFIATMRKEFNYFSKVHKNYKAGGNSTVSTEKRYEKLYVKDASGKHYLRGKYSIELLNSQKEVYAKANEELHGDNVAFDITAEEKFGLGLIGRDSIFRKDEGHIVGDILNLRTEGDKVSGRNYVVTDTNTYSLSEFDDVIEEVVKRYTPFTSYEELNVSKLYATESSVGSKQNPHLYAFLKKKENLTAYNIEQVESENDITSTEVYIQWIKDNFTISENGTPVPNRNFLDPVYASYNASELAANNLFTKVSNNSQAIYKKGSDLIVRVEGVSFHKLPSKHKHNLERRTNGDVVGMVKDFAPELLVRRQDDYEYAEPLDAKGNSVNSQRVHNRGFVENKNQSLELFDLYIEEVENQVKYKQRETLETNMSALADVVGVKKYYAKSKIRGGRLVNKNKPNSPYETIDGTQSNEYAKLEDIMESNVYDISMHYGGSFGKMDVNKLSSAINGLGASVALTMNVASGIANVINGLAQLHIEGAGGYFFNTKNLLSAEKDYTLDLVNITADLTRPVKTSKTNAILQMFDFVGGSSVAQQKFIKDNILKKGLSTGQMNALNDMGEHYMSSVLSNAILKNVKVMNSDHKFIDKEGNIVDSKEKAASVYEMIVFDPVTDLWIIDPKAVYTTHSYNLPMKDGGMASLSKLIKKKSNDLYGAYDTNLAASMQKKWWGKSLMMFKKFLLPGVQSRYKGIANINKSNEELREDELTFNESLRVREEGYYVTLGRFLYQSKAALQQHGINFISGQYKELSEYEQANMRKAVAELVITAVLVPALAMLLNAGWSDDDEDKPYAALYQVNRLSQELTQFYNPISIYKLTSNPVAGLTIINKALVLLEHIVTPIKLDPNYNESTFDWMNENAKGENKLLRSVFSVTPFLAQLNKDWKDLNNQIK